MQPILPTNHVFLYLSMDYGKMGQSPTLMWYVTHWAPQRQYYKLSHVSYSIHTAQNDHVLFSNHEKWQNGPPSYIPDVACKSLAYKLPAKSYGRFAIS